MRLVDFSGASGVVLGCAAAMLVSSPARAQNASGYTVTATGSTTPRTLAARAAVVLNIRDYGAVCDGSTDDTAALQAAFTAAASAARAGGAQVYVPGGTCRIAGATTLSWSDGRAVSLRGDGKSVSKLLFDGNGPTVSMTTAGAAFNVEGLTFRHNSTTTQAGTGLAMLASVQGTTALVRSVQFDGGSAGTQARAGSWNVGITALNIGPTLEDSAVLLPDVLSASTSSTATGVSVSGTSGSTNIFAIDTRITDSLLQGGVYGLKLSGPIQGVFWANSDSIGSNYGVYAVAATADYATYVTLANWHINSHISAFYSRGFNQISINQGLILHFGENSDPFKAIDIGNSSSTNIAGAVFTGDTSTGKSEEMIVMSNSSLVSLTANQGYEIEGPMIDVSATNNSVSISNNVASNFNSYLGPRIIGCGNSVTCLANNMDGGQDITTTPTDMVVNVPGALFAPEMFVNKTLAYGFVSTTGTLSQVLSQDSSGKQYVCSGSSNGCQVGAPSVPVSVGGPLSVGAVNVSSGVLPSTDNQISIGASNDRFVAVYATNFAPGSGGVLWTSSSAVPEGAFAAPVGSLYTCTSNGKLYVKESGGSTSSGWVMK